MHAKGKDSEKLKATPVAHLKIINNFEKIARAERGEQSGREWIFLREGTS